MRGLDCLVDIRVIKLANNKSLSTIGDLSNLSRLNSFYAEHCAFVEPPRGLERLAQLCSIDMSNNALKKAPSMRHLPLLHSVKLPDNDIDEAPDGLDVCLSLLNLDLGLNKIRSLPNLSRLTQLRVALLGNNDLSQPIEGLDNLPLRLLSLNDLDQSVMPTFTASLQSTLDELWLRGLGENQLPVGLSACTNLTMLDVKQLDSKTNKQK